MSPLNLTQKIIKEHLVSGKLKAGEEISLKIDQTLTQDATGTMTYLQWEALQLPKIKTKLSVSYIDHNTVQAGFENADDHRYLQSIAEKYGIFLSQAGNGICHQVHLERFGKPGKTLLGSDSHTPTGGGIGMLAIGAGGLDIAVAMSGEPFYLTCPRVIKINLTGKLKPWVTAKDVVLKILQIFSTKGNTQCVFEYGGDGVKNLSVPERATITNMGAECGVTTSLFPSDEVTRKFLKAQGREEDWVELKADKDASYDKEVTLDLSQVAPLVACPHSPGNIKEVRELEGMSVNQVCMGSCTNSSYKDLMTVSRMVEGKKIHPEVSLVIAPGSRQVLENINKEGALASLFSTGARVAEPVCGFCIGNSYAPPSDAISIRTSNRNFLGRSGTKSAKLYLTSPETAMASALKGKLTDPRDLDMDYPNIELPSKFYIDDSLILKPSPNSEVTIYRGPNIKKVPPGSPLPEEISGKATIKVGDKITTDHIIPAGSKMKYRSNAPKYSEFVFEVVDDSFYERAMRNKKEDTDNIIVGGESYGQGSSREHAALCPMFLGVKVVIAKSFERIHAGNLINFGILPLIFTSPSDYEQVEQGDELQISQVRELISKNQKLKVENKTKKEEFEVSYNLSPRQRKIILAGGRLPYIKDKVKD